MRHRLLARASRREDDRAVLPLINVVFLLLIFFMLAGRLAAGDPFPVEPPQAARADSQDSEDPIVLVGGNGRLALAGEVVTLPDLAQALRERGVDQVRLKADATTEAVQVVEIMQALHAAGVGKVRLLTSLRTP